MHISSDSLFQDSEETINSAEKNDTSYERTACYLPDDEKNNNNKTGQLKRT